MSVPGYEASFPLRRRRAFKRKTRKEQNLFWIMNFKWSMFTGHANEGSSFISHQTGTKKMLLHNWKCQNQIWANWWPWPQKLVIRTLKTLKLHRVSIDWCTLWEIYLGTITCTNNPLVERGVQNAEYIIYIFEYIIQQKELLYNLCNWYM